MYRAGIITTSDKGSRGEREDKSATVIKEMLPLLNAKLIAYKLIPDDFNLIKEILLEFVYQKRLDLIFTTGGTGFSRRDCTPEATRAVTNREVPGIPERMRLESTKKTPRAILSRATAGICEQTLIINLPGSPKAVRECLEIILPALPHGLEILTGQSKECGT